MLFKLLIFQKQFFTIPKLNFSIKLEEQPKFSNRYQALPGFSGNTIPAYDALEALVLHGAFWCPSLLSATTDTNPPAVLLSNPSSLLSAVEATEV